MLWSIFLILFALWLMGLISGYTVGSFVQALLVVPLLVWLMVPLILLVYQIVTGRRAHP